MVPTMLRLPALPHVRAALAVFVMLSLTACVNLTGGATPTAAEEDGPLQTVQEPRREYLFNTPENTVMDTPWFTVSSVILQVQRTQPETLIVVPADSKVRRFLGLSPFPDTSTTTIPGNRFLFNLGIMTDGVPAFTPDPDRYRYPDLYE